MKPNEINTDTKNIRHGTTRWVKTIPQLIDEILPIYELAETPKTYQEIAVYALYIAERERKAKILEAVLTKILREMPVFKTDAQNFFDNDGYMQALCNKLYGKLVLSSRDDIQSILADYFGIDLDIILDSSYWVDNCVSEIVGEK